MLALEGLSINADQHLLYLRELGQRLSERVLCKRLARIAEVLHTVEFGAEIHCSYSAIDLQAEQASAFGNGALVIPLRIEEGSYCGRNRVSGLRNGFFLILQTDFVVLF